MTTTRVAAIQLPFIYVANPQEFANLSREPVERAAQAGAELIVLPHYLSLVLLGMFEPDAPPGATVDELARRQNVAVTRDWLMERGQYLFEFYLHFFQSLSERVGAWLVPGTTLEPEGDTLFLTALIFDPAGQVIGRQRQNHLSSEELSWGISPGSELRAFNTEIGNLGILCGDDVRHSGTARALALQSAKVLIHPSAERDPVGNDAKTPLWQLAQSNGTFGIQAALCGGAYQGRSAIYAPVPYTENGSGILAQAPSRDQGAILLASLDLDWAQAISRDRLDGSTGMHPSSVAVAGESDKTNSLHDGD